MARQRRASLSSIDPMRSITNINDMLYFYYIFACADAYVALLVIWYISENSSIAVSTLYLYVLIIVNLMNS